MIKYCIVSLILIMLPRLNAQQKETPPDSTQARVAILAMGPKPQRRFGSDDQSNPDGASTLLPPKVYERPPAVLHFPAGTNKHSRINVSFNNPPSFITLPASKSIELLRIDSDKESSYLSISPLEPESVNLIILTPSGTSSKRWKPKPKAFVINFNNSDFQNKKLILINLSRSTIKTSYNHLKKRLTTEEMVSYAEQKGVKNHRFIAQYGRDNKMLMNTGLKINQEGNIYIFLFHDANPHTNDGRAVGLMRLGINLAIERSRLLKK